MDLGLDQCQETGFLRRHIGHMLGAINATIVIDYACSDKSRKYIDACRSADQHRGKYDYSGAALDEIITNKQHVTLFCMPCIARKYVDIPDPTSALGAFKWNSAMFKTRYTDHASKLYGCQECSSLLSRCGRSMSEIAAVEVAGEIFLTPVERTRGKKFFPTTPMTPEAAWLYDGCVQAGRSKNECLRLDGYCNTDKYGPIAIEYQGIQHYRFPNKFHKTKAEFNAQRARDILKETICLDSGVMLIKVMYTMTYRNREKMKNFMRAFIPDGL
jgi:hypothetical protein